MFYVLCIIYHIFYIMYYIPYWGPGFLGTHKGQRQQRAAAPHASASLLGSLGALPLMEDDVQGSFECQADAWFARWRFVD